MAEHADDATLARRIVVDLTALGLRVPAPVYGVLQQALASVRLDERRAIVVYLRERARGIPAGTLKPTPVDTTLAYTASLQGEADRIERGEHGAGS